MWHRSPIPPRFHPRLKAAGPGVRLWDKWMSMPQLLFPFPGTCLAARHRHTDVPTHTAHRGAGWWRGPRTLSPWLATSGLFNTHLFSPLQPPSPSDLSIVCFTSGTTGKQKYPGHQPGPPAPFPGSLVRLLLTFLVPSGVS